MYTYTYMYTAGPFQIAVADSERLRSKAHICSNAHICIPSKAHICLLRSKAHICPTAGPFQIAVADSERLRSKAPWVRHNDSQLLRAVVSLVPGFFFVLAEFEQDSTANSPHIYTYRLHMSSQSLRRYVWGDMYICTYIQFEAIWVWGDMYICTYIYTYIYVLFSFRNMYRRKCMYLCMFYVCIHR